MRMVCQFVALAWLLLWPLFASGCAVGLMLAVFAVCDRISGVFNRA
jgi:hypothetical protein